MKWICLKCGRKNDQTHSHCTKCGLDEEAALTYPVSKRKRTCEECGHTHREDTYCHAYTEAAQEDLVDDVISEGSEENESASDNDDDSDEDRPSFKMKKLQKMRPLKTPQYAKAAGYVRCNCNVGIPDSMKFEPIPQLLIIGGIAMETYHEITDESSRKRWLDYQASKMSQTALERKLTEDATRIAQMLPLILSYLPYGLCGPAPCVCSLWNWGTNQYKEYIDIRNCVPITALRPHTGQVDSVLIEGDKLYTGGDKRLLVSNYLSGELLSQITRDSGDIIQLRLQDGELYSCSTNGSIRSYGLTHTGRNIQLTNTFWEHTRAITDVNASIPSDGPCELHGITGHMCFLYSASEDRTIKMWSTQRGRCEETISNNSIRSGSYTKLAQSDRHLFAGTTNSTVAVFNKTSKCERDDVHLCNVPGADTLYCLQISLKLPPNLTASGNAPSVTGLVCTKFGPEYPTLWASDSSGQLTIWYVPATGLDFQPAYTVRAHKGSINALVKTWRHMITVGDDGIVKLFDILTFVRIRSIDVMQMCVERQLFVAPNIHRRLKSAHVYENYSTGGYIALGTSYGDVVIMPIGTTV